MSGRKFDEAVFKGVWSAMSTPLTTAGEVDEAAVAKLVEHQLRLGVKGLFIAGTAGEGPWLPDAERAKLVRATVAAAAGRQPVAMQITDNSAERMIENVKRYQDAGIDFFVLAPPFFQVGASQDFLVKTFERVFAAADIPGGVYNRGKYSSVKIEPATLARMLENPRVELIKDSAGDPEYIQVIMQAKAARKGALHPFSGDEFTCVDGTLNGYDGLILGGGCFNGAMAGKIRALTLAGQIDEARALQERMNEMMFRIFGGRDIRCWMAGQKTLMVRLGVFNTATTLLDYTLTPECSQAIDEVLAAEKEFLLP